MAALRFFSKSSLLQSRGWRERCFSTSAKMRVTAASWMKSWRMTLEKRSAKWIGCPAREMAEDGAHDEKRETEIECKDANVKRKEDRADQLRAEGESPLIGSITGGDLERIAAALEDFELFGFGQRAAEFRFLVFELGTDVFRQFAQDVFALIGGKKFCEIAEIAVERLHDITLSRFRLEMRRWLSIRREVLRGFPRRAGRAGKTVCCAFPLRAIR